MVKRMIALDLYEPIFLYCKIMLEHTMGDFEQGDRAIAATPLVGRLDVWLESVETAGTEWSEWEITAPIDLLSPVVAAKLAVMGSE